MIIALIIISIFCILLMLVCGFLIIYIRLTDKALLRAERLANHYYDELKVRDRLAEAIGHLSDNVKFIGNE